MLSAGGWSSRFLLTDGIFKPDQANHSKKSRFVENFTDSIDRGQPEIINGYVVIGPEEFISVNKRLEKMRYLQSMENTDQNDIPTLMARIGIKEKLLSGVIDAIGNDLSEEKQIHKQSEEINKDMADSFEQIAQESLKKCKGITSRGVKEYARNIIEASTEAFKNLDPELLKSAEVGSLQEFMKATLTQNPDTARQAWLKLKPILMTFGSDKAGQVIERMEKSLSR